MMNRRLKHRIPAALRALARRAPKLALIVTTTLVISPEAWAKIQSGEAEARFATHVYSKEELQQKAPTADSKDDINKRIVSEVGSILNLMAGGLGGTENHDRLEQIKGLEPGKEVYTARAAQLKDAPLTRRPDLEGMRSFFGLQFQRAARKEVVKMPLWTKLSNMARFNLNFGTMFSGSKSEPAPSSGSVRYGLIVENIEPAKDAKGIAAVNNMEDDLQYAGHADVTWTIGPLTEDQNRRVFDGVPGPQPSPAEPSAFDFKTPSLKFHTDANTENFDGDVTKVDPKALPNVRINLTQDDGYYSLGYRMTAHFQRLGVEHTVKVPVGGTVQIGRRVDDSFHVIETAAYNILYDKRLPSLSIHQMNVEQRFKAELATSIGDHQTLGITARGEAKGPVESGNEVDRPEAYSFDYSHEF